MLVSIVWNTDDSAVRPAPGMWPAVDRPVERVAGTDPGFSSLG